VPGGGGEDSRERKHRRGELVLKASLPGGERDRGEGRSGGGRRSLVTPRTFEPAVTRVAKTRGSRGDARGTGLDRPPTLNHGQTGRGSRGRSQRLGSCPLLPGPHPCRWFEKEPDALDTLVGSYFAWEGLKDVCGRRPVSSHMIPEENEGGRRFGGPFQYMRGRGGGGRGEYVFLMMTFIEDVFSHHPFPINIAPYCTRNTRRPNLRLAFISFRHIVSPHRKTATAR